jgi:hypothetical protein
MSTLKVNTIQKTGEGAPVILTADSSGNVTFDHTVQILGEITTSAPLGPSYYSFAVNSSITFSSSLSGRMGMTLTQARSHLSSQTAYSSWGNNTNYFDVVDGIIFWAVPQDGTYRFDVAGSCAGTLTWDGRGRGIRGSVNLKQGNILRILCGQRGNTVNGQYSGGGGGSVVALVTMGGGFKPLLIGSGGSGQTPNDPTETGRNNCRDARYAYSTDFQGENTPEPGRGSLYQNSYGSDITNYWYGGGGGSWSADGEEGTIGYWSSNLARPGNKGMSLQNQQPKGGWSEVSAHGGFGGGGGTGRDSGSGGGGGGWRGGDAMYVGTSATPSDNGGNTATCYYDVDLVSSTSDLGFNTGAGYVVLTRTA